MKVVIWSGWLYGEKERRAMKAGAELLLKKEVGGADVAELLKFMSNGHSAGPIPESGT